MAVTSPNDNIMSPANAAGVGNYVQMAQQNSSSGSAPKSVFEGMQTIANLSRVKAGYNPLDPEGKGSKANFLQFSQYLADLPALSLLNSSTKEVHQQEQNADKIIDSFVAAFEGIAQENVAAITSAVSNLAKAALSYSKKEQKYSNFAQNLLQVNSTGDVQFHLYSSVFQISQTESKGTITYKSDYSVLVAVYELAASEWGQISGIFNKQEKTSINDWLNNMKTPVKGAGGARALCLYPQLGGRR
ncbi:hypothetical protein CEQ90_16565 [Lewinellaceae bacterium SD302]|nr:hypothetical protein CEQ90_16565 [Lewinellaceae bacterium SD302]